MKIRHNFLRLCGSACAIFRTVTVKEAITTVDNKLHFLTLLAQFRRNLMSHNVFSASYKFARRITPFFLAAIAVLVVTASASAQAECRRVRGFYEEQAVAPTSCPSPVGLCIEGEFSGNVKGAFASTATALQPSGDTPLTSVLWFTGDGVIHAKIDSRQGDIFFKSSGAFQSSGDGNIVDLQYITGGTGDLVGASGVIRASGTFNPVTGKGESEYEGLVCTP
jgi:hypothetical protein